MSAPDRASTLQSDRDVASDDLRGDVCDDPPSPSSLLLSSWPSIDIALDIRDTAGSGCGTTAAMVAEPAALDSASFESPPGNFAAVGNSVINERYPSLGLVPREFSGHDKSPPAERCVPLNAAYSLSPSLPWLDGDASSSLPSYRTSIDDSIVSTTSSASTAARSTTTAMDTGCALANVQNDLISNGAQPDFTSNALGDGSALATRAAQITAEPLQQVTQDSCD